MTDLGKRLDKLRRPSENKKQFAQRLGISPVQFSRYLKGVMPGREVLTRISEVTGVSVDWLLGEGEPEVARRLAARTTRNLKDPDLIALACSYLDELETLSREQKEMLKEILRDLPAHPDRLASLSTFLRFLRLEARRGK
jgi:transcriptional regulator with XRE-family HTH domain